MYQTRVRLTLLCAAILAPALASGQGTPLQRRVAQIGAIARQEPISTDTVFGPAFRRQVSDPQLHAVFDQMTQSFGVLDSLTSAPVAGTADSIATLRFVWHRGFSSMATVVLSPGTAFQIIGLQIRGTTSNARTLAEVATTLRALPGRNALLIGEIVGSKVVPMVAVDTGTALAIGSAFKLYVLAAITRDIEEGSRRWNDSVPYDSTGRSLPSGRSQAWPGDTTASLRDWASLMISISDNTAADRMLHLEGREKVEEMQSVVGNAHARRNIPFLTTREMFALKSPAQQPAKLRYLAGTVAMRRATLVEIDHLPQAAIRPDFSAGPVSIDSVEWFASVADLGRTMVWLRDHSAAHDSIGTRAILAINPGLPLSKTTFPYIGFKGGSEPGVINLTYLLQRSDGRWFVVSETSNNPAADVQQGIITALVQRVGELLAPAH